MKQISKDNVRKGRIFIDMGTLYWMAGWHRKLQNRKAKARLIKRFATLCDLSPSTIRRRLAAFRHQESLATQSAGGIKSKIRTVSAAETRYEPANFPYFACTKAMSKNAVGFPCANVFLMAAGAGECQYARGKK